MELSGLQIFKYLPAGKKTENSNCKKCGCPTCMAFALKLAKNGISIDACPNIPTDLRELFEHSKKITQETIEINNIKIGGENVLHRHEKTFINPTALCVLLDCNENNFEQKLNKIQNFEINILNRARKVDLIILKNSAGQKIDNSITFEEFQKLKLKTILDNEFTQTAQELKTIRIIQIQFAFNLLKIKILMKFAQEHLFTFVNMPICLFLKILTKHYLQHL